MGSSQAWIRHNCTGAAAASTYLENLLELQALNHAVVLVDEILILCG